MTPVNGYAETHGTSVNLWDRLTLACGIGFTTLLFGSVAVLPEMPSVRTSGIDLANWFIANRDAFLAQSYLRSATAFLMVLFVGGVAGVIRRAAGGESTAARLAFGGAVMFSLVMFVSNIACAAAALLAGQVEPDVVRGLNMLGETMRFFNGFSGALMAGAASVGLLRARAVNRGVGIFGLVAAPLFLIGSAGFPGTALEMLNAIAFPLVPLWPLVTSLALLVRTRAPRRVAPAQVVTAA